MVIALSLFDAVLFYHQLSDSYTIDLLICL